MTFRGVNLIREGGKLKEGLIDLYGMYNPRGYLGLKVAGNQSVKSFLRCLLVSF